MTGGKPRFGGGPADTEDSSPIHFLAFQMSASIQTRVTAMEAEMAAQKERLAPIEERLAPIEERLAQLPDASLIAALAERLAALELAKAPAPKPRGRPPKAKAEQSEPAPPPADAPGPDHYRLSAYDETLCMARKLKPSAQDRHWSPVAYFESQCSGKPVEGEGLCTSCCALRDKEMEAGKLKHWNGRVDEDPADDALLTVSVHMIGTEWAKKCTWSKDASPVKAKGDSEASAEKETKKAAAKEAKAAEKAAASAAKAAEKEAAKAAKAAEKAAASAAKKEAKDKSKPKAEKPKKEAKKDKAAESAVAATEEQPVGGEYTMLLIDGELRVTKNGNVYELDELTQLPGDFLGRLIGSTDAPAIDADADEVVESDAE